MPNENIFGDGDPTPTNAPQTPEGQPVVTPPTVDPFTPILEGIKGDDGQPKYRDVPTALNALQHSQEYIKQLKQQLEEATQKASQAVTMEQVLETLKKQEAATGTPTTPAPSQGLTADDVLRLLKEKDLKEKASANASVVAKKFKEVHGEKAEEFFYGKAAEMGLSREAVNQLASSSPAAVFSMFGIKDGQLPVPPTPSGVNTSGMQAPTPQPLGTVMGFKKDVELAEYWSKLKAEVNANLGIK